jgi:hypothetical protein
MSASENEAINPDVDRLVSFTLPDRDARGRIVRLGPVLHRILSAHSYAPVIKHLLAEALVVTALLGGLLKRAGSQLTLQAQTEGGIVDLLVCDYRDGELRGYVKHDLERLADVGAKPSLSALFGKGYLAITFDVAGVDQCYQGVVPLEGATLAEAVEAYFDQSEQLPTLIRTGVRAEADVCLAGGLLVQHRCRRRAGPPPCARRPARMGPRRDPGTIGPGRGTGRPAVVFRGADLAAVQRGARDPSAGGNAVVARVPMLGRALRGSARPLSEGGPARDAR